MRASGGRSRRRARSSGRRRGGRRGTRWGRRPGVTPVHSEVYGFMRSPVEERGRSWRKTSRSSGAGTSFSIPTTVMSVSGRVVQKRPLPSDSTTQTVPVSATAKLAPLIATRARRNRSRRWRRAASASSLRLVGEVGQAEPVAEEVADLGAVLVDRRDEDVRGALVGELADQLRQVRLDHVDPGRGERVVEADLVGGQRLHLHDLALARRLHEPGDDAAGLLGVARPVHVAARRSTACSNWRR